MQPPDSTPEFPEYNAPLPPPGETYTATRQPQTGGYGGRPPRGPVVSFDAIGEAWNILSPNIGVWVAAVLVTNIISWIPASIGYVFLFLGMFRQIQANPGSTAPPSIVLGPLLVFYLFLFISVLLTGCLSAGLVRMGLDNVRTGRVEFGRLFSTTDVLPQIIGATLLIMIGYLLGAMCCVIPGLLFVGVTMFTFPLIVEKKMGALQAISASIEILKSQMWMALAYTLVLMLITNLGSLVCCVGYFVAFPLVILSLVITYRDFYPEGEIPNYQPPAARAPLADPNS